MDVFAERAFIDGWELEKVVWTVPQGFGTEEYLCSSYAFRCSPLTLPSRYWTRNPTGEEFVVQSIVGINHGGLGMYPSFLYLFDLVAQYLLVGVVSWDDPTTPEIKASASALALALTSGPSNMSAFILNPSSTFKQVTTTSGIDTGMWTLDRKTLLLATNMNYENTTLEAAELGLGSKGFGGGLTEVFCSGLCSAGDESVVFGSVGSGGFVFSA